MKNTTNNNISLSAIHTFTIVAQELSFTRSAEILHITPSAVSHQMKLLESQMAVTLFHRQSKGVRLTLAGEKLQQHATSGMRNIQHGILQSQFASQKEKLTIAVIPSLCQLWLMPRLVSFLNQHPQIELELIAIDQLVNFNSGQYDAHIHFGTGDYQGCEAKFLQNEQVYPVCHPDMIQDIIKSNNEANNINNNKNVFQTLINRHPLLIYKAGIEDEPGGISWGNWLHHFSIEKPVELKQMCFSHVSMTILAAKLKQGIALGWHHMVKNDIANGQLLKLTDNELNTTFNYYLVAPSRSWKNETFNHFSTWLEQEMHK